MKKIILLIMGIVCLVVFTACGVNEKQTDDSNKQIDSSQNSSDSKQESVTITGDVQYYNKFEDVYRLTENSSMALVEVINIGEPLSTDPSFGGYCLMLECKVIEDYYKKIPEGTKIYVPVVLPYKNVENKQRDKIMETSSSDSAVLKPNKQPQIDAESLTKFLQDYQQAIIYIGCKDDSQKWYKNGDLNECVKIESVTNEIFLDHDFMPLSNNTVHLNNIKDFHITHDCKYGCPEEHIYDFKNFIYDGITLQEAKENICELYQSQVQK